MTQAFMQTHLQRPTDTLQNSDTKRQIESVFDFSYLIQKGQYNQAGKLLNDILLTTNSQGPNKEYDSFLLELKYNAILTEMYEAKDKGINSLQHMEKCMKSCLQLLRLLHRHQKNYREKEEQDDWPYAHYLQIRIYTTLVQICVRTNHDRQDQFISSLVHLLEDHENYLPEVMGKLCGCKDLKGFCVNFNSDQILQNDQKTFAQKAKLIDMASTWFILGSHLDKGLKLKEKAVQLWKSANNLKQYEKCQTQYMELRSNSNSEFCVRLKRLARIILKLMKGIEEAQQQNQKPIKKVESTVSKQTSVIVKKGLAKSLNDINEFNEQLDRIEDEAIKASKKKSIWSSFKKSTSLSSKKSILNDSKLLEYYEKAHEFRTQCYAKQKHEEITSLLENNSKFVLDQKKVMSKAIVPLVQLYTKRRKWAFLIWKNAYLVKFGLLNPDFLKSLALNKSLSQKKNTSPEKSFISPSRNKNKNQAQNEMDSDEESPQNSVVRSYVKHTPK